MSKSTSKGFRQHLNRIIFESDTKGGKLFDVLLLLAILLSVLTVVLESVAELRAQFHTTFLLAEWIFTLLFTVEYLLRIYSAKSRKGYIISFYGVVDLLSILPTYLSLIAAGWQYLLVVRGLRLLRVARIFKLTHFLREGHLLRTALRASAPKILVFVFSILTMVVIIGSVMYLIEGPERGYTSIPKSMYWAIVTLTTVGYGDITPQTPLGQMLASLVMIMGYGIIAVPTGIVTVELGQARHQSEASGRACPTCGKQGHEPDARFCNRCAARLPETAGTVSPSAP